MATQYGLLSTGFSPKTIDIILSELKTQVQSYFGVSVDVDNGALSRLLGILAERYATLWDLTSQIVSSQSADKATGVYLDAVAMLVGVLRIQASYSTTTLTLTGVPTTNIPVGQRLHTASTIQYFLTATSGTIVVVPSWTALTFVPVGTRVTNANNVYQCIVAGTSSATGPTGSPGVTGQKTLVEGTVTWRFLGYGTGATDVVGQAVLQGAIAAVSGDLSVIDTPVGGWSSSDNVLDATPGYATQSDEAFRLTREQQFSLTGTSTAPAILAALVALTGVTAVTVFVNETDTTDAFGLLPHSVEALVLGGTDLAVATLLYNQVAAGIRTAGNTSYVITDSQGVAHTISYSRPVVYNIGVSVTLTKDPLRYSALTGDSLVAQAIVAAGNSANRGAGYDAVSSTILAWCFGVLGVLDVTALPFVSAVLSPGVPPTPTTSTTIAISTRQLAVYSVPWVTVVSTNGTP